ncbi:MAG: hypothetical protein GY854_33265 [Deltaproteobacteria bacterium]|nr:hypothetical protein [Deltaproteobacteria bacterium]
MSIFRDELVYLHTNLSLLRQIKDFDFLLFPTGGTFFRFVARNLATQSVLIVTRLWGDTSKKGLTLDRFRKWLTRSVRRSYLQELEMLLDSVRPDQRIEKLIRDLRNIRHADLAHLDERVKLGFETPPTPVKLEDLQQVAESLGLIYNSTNFGAETFLVLINLQAPSGRSYEGQLGYILDLLALNSKWFRIAEQDSHLWSEYRAKLSAEDLKKLNALRERHGIAPLV